MFDLDREINAEGGVDNGFGGEVTIPEFDPTFKFKAHKGSDFSVAVFFSLGILTPNLWLQTR